MMGIFRAQLTVLTAWDADALRLDRRFAAN
jgi:hypothetical protein